MITKRSSSAVRGRRNLTEPATRRYDVAVIGGGAAGSMCAIEAGKRGRSVLLLDTAQGRGKKILISGGGRCNFTNLYATPENYLSANPNFARSALSRYTPSDFIALVERHGIAYHEKKLGQLFCDGSSRQIVDMLNTEAAAAGVETLDARVVSVSEADSFRIETDAGAFESESLVVASGGLSIPKMGATDFGYRLAKQFGLGIVEPRPGLVPLTFAGDDLSFCAELSGVSLDVVASCAGQSFHENLLFTHDGLSGPAILQISSYWPSGKPISIDLLPGQSALDMLTAHKDEARELVTVLGDRWPRRFAQAWCARHAPSRPINRFGPRELEGIAALIEGWELRPSGTRGFGKAEVTVGGVDTAGLDSRTMQARRVPGLYFIGEVVDVTGWLGGYNFQWAWASGYAAGQSV
ncbi:MAG: aminoacetone oxidase family FAD-binding enzyme [Dehalococcoidia bacterium]|nr:aminoacetone oxidase family FAD-binding enzyme [Dehalococcoidia bacterium]